MTLESLNLFCKKTQTTPKKAGKQSSGVVTVSFSATDSRIRVSVSDNGKGIPPELLPRVFDRDFTHDKPGGTGLGLHQAKKAIEWHEGSIHIESEPGKGTMVTIELRQETTPDWLGEQITVPMGYGLCFFDDDPSMLSFWKSRMANHADIPASYHPAIRDLATAPLKDSILVVDHFFRDEKTTGLDVLEGLDGLPPTYLCTTAYDDPEVQNRAVKLGIRIIPKPLIQSVDFAFERS